MVRTRWLLVFAMLCLTAGSCTGAATPDRLPVAAAPTEPVAAGNVTVQFGERPFVLHVPSSYRPGTAVPLVVALHGHGSSAAALERYFQLTAESDRRGFLYAMPDGTAGPDGRRFWNATAVCCDTYGTGVDDSDYLRRLIVEVAASYSVDPHRVYIVGHSNGGYMAYRTACDHAELITAIVSLAGAMFRDLTRCRPARPVSVLQIHGTADQTVRFGGDPAGRGYPPVETTVADWRRFDGCSDTADMSAPPKDLVANLAGAETTVTSYHAGCRAGTRVELWSIQDGPHVPAIKPAFAPTVLDFLYAQVASA